MAPAPNLASAAPTPAPSPAPAAPDQKQISEKAKAVLSNIKVAPKISKKKAAAAPVAPGRVADTLIAPVRAMYEYCLDPSHLETLPRQVKRSPFHGEKKTFELFLRSDVEQKAIEVHGSKEALQKAKSVRDLAKSVRVSFSKKNFLLAKT